SRDRETGEPSPPHEVGWRAVAAEAAPTLGGTAGRREGGMAGWRDGGMAGRRDGGTGDQVVSGRGQAGVLVPVWATLLTASGDSLLMVWRSSRPSTTLASFSHVVSCSSK